MLTITAHAVDPREVDTDLVVVPVFKGGIEGPGASLVRLALGLEAFPTTPDFRGDIGQHLLLSAPGIAAGGVLLVGLGRMDAVHPERLRRAAGVAAQAAAKVGSVATTLAEVAASRDAYEAVAEGFHLGAHRDLRFRSEAGDDAPALAEVRILAPSSRLWEARAAIERAEVTARATIAARELVNLPPDRKRPAALAQQVAELVGDAVEVEVRDEAALAELGFGGHLAVGGGSAEPPRFVELRHRPEQALGHVVLVGKGITFDTGGLSLKRGGHMDDMKSDMAGAAVIAAAMSVLGELDVPLAVTGLLCLAENMPSGSAQRPGDIFTAYGGTTVEVLDTDAEGRLVLADGLAYAAELEPDAIVDLATLTGSVIGALGHYAAGAMGTDADLCEALCAAGRAAGEDVWALPLWDRLDRFLDTPVADVANIADEPGGGALTAGLFLRRFVGDVPWVHLDIAGPAFLPKPLAEGYLPAGATGFGVRTLLAWLERRAA